MNGVSICESLNDIETILNRCSPGTRSGSRTTILCENALGLSTVRQVNGGLSGTNAEAMQFEGPEGRNLLGASFIRPNAQFGSLLLSITVLSELDVDEKLPELANRRDAVFWAQWTTHSRVSSNSSESRWAWVGSFNTPSYSTDVATDL